MADVSQLWIDLRRPLKNMERPDERRDTRFVEALRTSRISKRTGCTLRIESNRFRSHLGQCFYWVMNSNYETKTERAIKEEVALFRKVE